MLKSRERWILHYLMHLEAVPPEAPNAPSLGRSLQYLETLFQRGDAHAEVDGVTIRILAMDRGTRWVSLLVANFDPRGADPAFGTAQTGAVRRLTRRQGEANAYSAHVLIKLDSAQTTAGGLPRFRLAIEDVPGLGKTRLLPFFNQLLRPHQIDFVDRQGQRGQYHVKFSLWPFRSEPLEQQIEEGGGIRHFELVSLVSSDGPFDEQGYTTEVRRVVTLKPTGQGTAREMLEAVRRRARNQHVDQVKIIYNGAEGNQRTAKFNPSRQDLDDVIQSKYEKIDLQNPLTQCETALSDEVLDRMRGQMRGTDTSTPDEAESRALTRRRRGSA